jgi:hypothetical protein
MRNDVAYTGSEQAIPFGCEGIEKVDTQKDLRDLARWFISMIYDYTRCGSAKKK